jgi:hypothetical protein|tara:strand:+ start:179 stop:430 length:252 start_codon:yes stop_codon:yes gene_type:complete
MIQELGVKTQLFFLLKNTQNIPITNINIIEVPPNEGDTTSILCGVKTTPEQYKKSISNNEADPPNVIKLLLIDYKRRKYQWQT